MHKKYSSLAQENLRLLASITLVKSFLLLEGLMHLPDTKICRLNDQEWLKCESLRLYHSNNGGQTWECLPDNRTLWTRIAQAPCEWPPIPKAVGWRQNQITVAHSDFHEDGLPNFRYLSNFDLRTQRWSTKPVGPVSDYEERWWLSSQFERFENV